MSYGVRQLTQGAFSPVRNVGKPYKTTLKPEKGKNAFYVNLINGFYIYSKSQIGSKFQFQITAPHPSSLPSGERDGVRGLEFWIWVIGIFLEFGAFNFVMPYTLCFPILSSILQVMLETDLKVLCDILFAVNDEDTILNMEELCNQPFHRKEIFRFPPVPPLQLLLEQNDQFILHP